MMSCSEAVYEQLHLSFLALLGYNITIATGNNPQTLEPGSRCFANATPWKVVGASEMLTPLKSFQKFFTHHTGKTR